MIPFSEDYISIEWMTWNQTAQKLKYQYFQVFPRRMLLALGKNYGEVAG
jgi:hypothetical protein